MKKYLLLAAAFLLAVVPSIPSAQAVSLGFAPSSQTKLLGSSLNVDVVVSGLHGTAAAPQVVSAFDLDVLYNSAILGNASINFAPAITALGLDPADDGLLFGSNLSAGRIDLFALSLLSDADLQALQGDSVTIATLGFTAIGLGTSPLSFDPATFPGIDVKGLNAAMLTPDVFNGSVTVIDNGTPVVPEPGTVMLVGAGLAGLLLLRRRNS